MASVYDQEVVVRIWRNVKTLKVIPTGHFGHAAVTLRGSLVPTPSHSAYISFWPGESASIGKSAIRKQGHSVSDDYFEDKINEMNRLTALRLEVGYRQHHGIPIPDHWTELLDAMGKPAIATATDRTSRGQKRLPGQFWYDDDGAEYPLWSQSADTKIKLPGLGATGRLWGLSMRRMYEWWTSFIASNPYYKALSGQNCAGVALWALRAGGAEAFQKLPTVMIYAEPVQVERYANALLHRMNELDLGASLVERDLQERVMDGRIPATPSDKLVDGIWTSKTWKEKSHLGGLTVRSSTIRDIDSAVDRFHGANWDDGFADRYKAMVDIMTAIIKHRQEKADSKRSEAVLRLAAQVIAILRSSQAVR